MTTQAIVVMLCGYAVALAAVIYFTRATMRRVMGALAGGAARFDGGRRDRARGIRRVVADTI